MRWFHFNVLNTSVENLDVIMENIINFLKSTWNASKRFEYLLEVPEGMKFVA